MRRFALPAFLALAALTAWPAGPAWSQISTGGGRGQGGQDQQDQEDAARRKRDQEWGNGAASLPQLRNAGPCPFVKVLYDAARYVDFKDGKEASASVAYTGEMQKISATCAYKDAQPIKVGLQVLFEFGRGPQGTDSHRTYRYWVAVTDRNQAVLAKEYFDVAATFPAGQDRVTQTETVGEITIPRADIKVSGANFEVLVGFDVTPEMAAFNRDGKRFRVNAGQTAAAAP